jgi:hypothetical protein
LSFIIVETFNCRTTTFDVDKELPEDDSIDLKFKVWLLSHQFIILLKEPLNKESQPASKRKGLSPALALHET